MKILFFSDIHGITNNLNIIDKKIKEKHIDSLICLGDLYETYSFKPDSHVSPKEVLNFLNNYKNILTCMKGNCDTLYDISMSPFNIYSGFKEINIEGRRFFITHGNIYNMFNDSIMEKGDILIFGHEHTPYIKERDGKTFINVGSISLPRNNSNPSFAIYENGRVTIYDVYDNIIGSVEV